MMKWLVNPFSMVVAPPPFFQQHFGCFFLFFSLSTCSLLCRRPRLGRPIMLHLSPFSLYFFLSTSFPLFSSPLWQILVGLPHSPPPPALLSPLSTHALAPPWVHKGVEPFLFYLYFLFFHFSPSIFKIFK